MAKAGSRWLDWEIELVNDRAGLLEPVGILRQLNKRREELGLPPRTKDSLYRRSCMMGLSLKMIGSNRMTISGWATSLGYFTPSALYDAYDKYADAHPGTRQRPKDGREMIFSLETIDKVLAFRLSLARKMGAHLLRAHGFKIAPKAVEEWTPEFKKPGNRPCRRVKNLTTGEIFPSVAQAGRSSGISTSSITWAAKEGRLTHGCEWAYLDPPIEYNKKKPTVLVSLNNGRVWCDERHAAQELGVSPLYIRQAAKKGFAVAGVMIEYRERA
jgi:hypothetical protein